MEPVFQREAVTRSAQGVQFDVPAGGTVSQNIYGQSFYLIEASGPLQVKTDKTAFKIYNKGQGEEFTDEFRYSRIEFYNPNAYAVSVYAWMGFGRYIDSRFSLVEQYVKAVGVVLPSGQLAGLTTVALNGVPFGTQIQRKAILVSNLDIASRIDIRDDSNTVINYVFPSTSVIIPVSGPVNVYNSTGSAIACSIAELWYVTGP